MNGKKSSRVRRSLSTRLRIRQQGAVRLSIHRTNSHVYAQVISACGGRVLASASTLEASFSGATCNSASAAAVGKLIAERAKSVGVVKVAFDRAGFKYHGKIKALADAAREHGLEF